jgi:hypothetical protein
LKRSSKKDRLDDDEDDDNAGDVADATQKWT